MKKFLIVLGVTLLGTSLFGTNPARLPRLKKVENIQYDSKFAAAADAERENASNQFSCNLRTFTSLQGSALKAGSEQPDIIYDQPEGEVKYYSRSGYATMVYMGALYFVKQSGSALEVVFAPDGKTVYFKDLISSATAGTWVKGERNGNAIHIPLCQSVLYNKSFDDSLVLGIGEIGEEVIDGHTYINYFKTEDAEVVFNEAEDGTLTIQSDLMLDSEEPQKLLGLFSYKNGEWQGYSNWNSTFEPLDEEPLQMPEDATVEDWHIKYQELEYEPIDGDRILHCAVVGDKFYLQGLSDGNPKSCIVGTIKGNKVSFPAGQYLGMNYGYVTYFCGAAFEKKLVYDDYFEIEMEKTFYTVYDEYEVDYDAAAKTIIGRKGDAILVAEGYPESGEIIHEDYFCDYTMKLYDEKPTMPKTPFVTGFYDYLDVYGYNGINLEVSSFDADNYFLNPEKLYYSLWIKRGGSAEKYNFAAENYFGFADYDLSMMDEVPYLFECYDGEGYVEISKAGRAILFYEQAPDEIGVQSIYYGGGERNETPVSWYKVSGINDVEISEAMPVDIYSIDGIRRNTLEKGINIVKMSDGSTRKILLR